MISRISRSPRRSRKNVAVGLIALAFLISVTAASAARYPVYTFNPNETVYAPSNSTQVTYVPNTTIQNSSIPVGSQLSGLAMPLSSTCPSGYRYAGYWSNEYPGVGSNGYVRLRWNTASIYSGHVSTAISEDNADNTVWIQAGLSRKLGDGGITKYVEYTTSAGTYAYVPKGIADPGTEYNAYIYHVDTGLWTASIGGNGLGYNVSLSGVATTYINGESAKPASGTCNAMDINFSNSYLGTANMMKQVYSPYQVDSITSNGWRSHGG